MYRSAYEEPFLTRLAEHLRTETAATEAWCVFDNTQLGAAGNDALKLTRLTAASAPPPAP